MPSCGSCRRCLDVCPTDAFPEPDVLDARRCISYLTIELKDWIPRELRPLLGNWIYGCDLCQIVCPFNRFAQVADEVSYFPNGGRGSGIGDWGSGVGEVTMPFLLDLLALDEVGFMERFARSPIKRIKRVKLIRNVCVAVGNWGSETAVPQLTALLADPSPIIRGHAAWALHQIGTLAAKTAVATALETETDAQVRAELMMNIQG